MLASNLLRVSVVLIMIGMLLGIAAVLLGGPSYEVCVIIGSLIAFTGMVLFAIVVFRNGAPARA